MKNLFLFSLFFCLTACNQSPPSSIGKLSANATILAFGDSLTYGKGASKNANYPSVLSRITQHKVINAGISGEITQQGLARLPALLDQHQPELLILIHGGNDLIRKIPAEETAANLIQMIIEAQQRHIKIVMLGVPAPRLFSLSSAEIYQHIAKQHNIPIDLETLPHILSDNNLKSDAIHPNDKGYQLLADHIFSLLVNTGAL